MHGVSFSANRRSQTKMTTVQL